MREVLLQKRLEFNERDFFKDRFTETELMRLSEPIGLPGLFAWRSPSLKKLDRGGKELSGAMMLRLMLDEPRLIRRPMVQTVDKLFVGSNPKDLEALLTNLE